MILGRRHLLHHARGSGRTRDDLIRIGDVIRTAEIAGLAVAPVDIHRAVRSGELVAAQTGVVGLRFRRDVAEGWLLRLAAERGADGAAR